MDKDEIWNKTLVLLLEDTDEEDPKTVFLNLLTPVGVFGDQFVLLAESTPVESWVRKNYLTEIQDKLLQVMGTPVSVGLGVSTQKEAPQQTTPAPVETVQQPEPDWMNQFVDPSSLSGHSPSPNMAAAEEAERVGGRIRLISHERRRGTLLEMHVRHLRSRQVQRIRTWCRIGRRRAAGHRI